MTQTYPRDTFGASMAALAYREATARLTAMQSLRIVSETAPEIRAIAGYLNDDLRTNEASRSQDDNIIFELQRLKDDLQQTVSHMDDAIQFLRAAGQINICAMTAFGLHANDELDKYVDMSNIYHEDVKAVQQVNGNLPVRD